MIPRRRRRWGPPEFANRDEIYRMNSPTNNQTIRMREIRSEVENFLRDMQRLSFLPEDSKGVAEMEQAWVTIWNEFQMIMEASETSDIRRQWTS